MFARLEWEKSLAIVGGKWRAVLARLERFGIPDARASFQAVRRNQLLSVLLRDAS